MKKILKKISSSFIVLAVLAASFFPSVAHAAGAITFLQTATDTVGRTTYTFSTQNFGTASANRYIIVGIGARDDDATGATTLNSVTIGGVAATIDVNHKNTGNSNITFAALAKANVPTGTSGDIVLTFSAAVLRAGIAVYSATGIGATATDTGGSSADDPTTALDIAAGGIVIGTGYTSQASTGNTTSGITEDYDTIVSANSAFVGGSGEVASAEIGLATIIDFGSPLNSGGAFASYPASTGGAEEDTRQHIIWFDTD